MSHFCDYRISFVSSRYNIKKIYVYDRFHLEKAQLYKEFVPKVVLVVAMKLINFLYTYYLYMNDGCINRCHYSLNTKCYIMLHVPKGVVI